MLTRRLYLLLLLGVAFPLLVVGFVLVYAGSQRVGYVLVAVGFVLQGALLFMQSRRDPNKQ